MVESVPGRRDSRASPGDLGSLVCAALSPVQACNQQAGVRVPQRHWTTWGESPTIAPRRQNGCARAQDPGGPAAATRETEGGSRRREGAVLGQRPLGDLVRNHGDTRQEIVQVQSLTDLPMPDVLTTGADGGFVIPQIDRSMSRAGGHRFHGRAHKPCGPR